jgi:hypothetical protein
VVHEALDADGGTRNTIITKTADKFFAELVWYTNALKQARQRGMFLANQ